MASIGHRHRDLSTPNFPLPLVAHVLGESIDVKQQLRLAEGNGGLVHVSAAGVVLTSLNQCSGQWYRSDCSRRRLIEFGRTP